MMFVSWMAQSLASATLAVYLASVRSAFRSWFGRSDPIRSDPIRPPPPPVSAAFLKASAAQARVNPSSYVWYRGLTITKEVRLPMLTLPCFGPHVVSRSLSFCVAARSPLEIHSSRPVICPWPTLRFTPVLLRPPSCYGSSFRKRIRLASLRLPRSVRSQYLPRFGFSPLSLAS